MERRFLVFDNLEAAILDSTGQRTNLHQPSSTMHAIQTADLKVYQEAHLPPTCIGIWLYNMLIARTGNSGNNLTSSVKVDKKLRDVHLSNVSRLAGFTPEKVSNRQLCLFLHHTDTQNEYILQQCACAVQVIPPVYWPNSPLLTRLHCQRWKNIPLVLHDSY